MAIRINNSLKAQFKSILKDIWVLKRKSNILRDKIFSKEIKSDTEYWKIIEEVQLNEIKITSLIAAYNLIYSNTLNYDSINIEVKNNENEVIISSMEA